VAFVGVLFAFVYPTRTLLDQRRATDRAHSQVELLRRENAKLAGEAHKLDTDVEIARIAREYYGLVQPGEQPFVILPTPTTSAPPTGGAAPAP
jgi:cell division protein FtsB